MTDERVRTQATFQIGEVATRVGLSQRTIRHYDDLGIIKPSARTAGGFRLYTESDVQRFLLIKPFKSLGVGLEEARALTGALDVLEGTSATPEQREHARASLQRISTLIAERRAELEEALGASIRTVTHIDALLGVAPAPVLVGAAAD
ncbi:MAG: MerR family transcriptional regulator [Acidimicrobiia bacterium]